LSWPPRFPAIVGREEELAAVTTFLDGEFPAALVLAGEAGIGKTTVWRAGLEQEREREVRVLVSAGNDDGEAPAGTRGTRRREIEAGAS
jgi:guanylate kinase